jgi:hypothetical protein
VAVLGLTARGTGKAAPETASARRVRIS